MLRDARHHGIADFRLVIFLGVHSLCIFANSWRKPQIARLGEER